MADKGKGARVGSAPAPAPGGAKADAAGGGGPPKASDAAGQQAAQQPMAHPAPGGKFAGLGKFCCNKEEGSCMGRTGLSWAKITIFYLIFYVFLAVFFLVCLLVALSSFDGTTPRLTGSESILGEAGPGLGYRPLNINSEDKNSRESALIWFNMDDEKTYKDYTKQLEHYTTNDTDHTKYMHCHNLAHDLKECVSAKGGNSNSSFMPAVYNDDNGGNGSVPTHLLWKKCNAKDNFGFAEGKPCILIRLNRIIDWIPGKLGKPVPFGSAISTPRDEVDTNIIEITDTTEVVCIYCEGESTFDKQVIGNIEYFPGGHRPGPCIPKYFFPYLNQANYLSPFIFVHFPDLPLGVLVQVRCTAFNEKIVHDPQLGRGLVKFELLVDNKVTYKA